MNNTVFLAEETDKLTAAIQAAGKELLSLQREDGHWCFELEADCTVPADYLITRHYSGEIDPQIEGKIAVYLRSKQNPTGGWPLYYGGASELACSVKTYFALKLAGDTEDQEHMQRARRFILSQGGAAKANVFTRIALALFQQVPWRAVPFIPVEILLLPRWFPFHISKIAYWSRSVMVPLLVICSLKCKAKNPKKIGVAELFITPPELEKHYFKSHSLLSRVFLILDRMGRTIEPLIPKKIRQLALKKAKEWFVLRLNGEDGLGAISPAIINSYMALLALGYSPDHAYCQQVRKAIEKLLVVRNDYAYCQPCLSPVWDTALSCLALQAEGSRSSLLAVERALNWLKPLQILDGPADWREYNPQLPPGGWAFEYQNSYYPDLDDTAVVGWTMRQQNNHSYDFSVERAANWLAGMQSDNGGFASFDQNNQFHYLNEIPFADHGALLDPPTGDVTARCLTLFSSLNRPQDTELVRRSIDYLLKDQEINGSWFGRWGTNYIYGTWSVLTALRTAGITSQHPAVRKAVDWLQSKQHPDGGWGENNNSYFDPDDDHQPSSSYQTAWALLGLMAAGEARSNTVLKGIQYLVDSQKPDGLWQDPWFTAPGFPKVFYLKYHGYCKYFPLWALAEYRRLITEK